MLDVESTFEESHTMAGPFGAVAFVALKALSATGAPPPVRDRVRAELFEDLGWLADADCNVLAEVAHHRLEDRPAFGDRY